MTADGKVARSIRVAYHAGSQGRKIEKVTSVDGQIFDRFLANRGGDRCSARFDVLPFCGDINDGYAAARLEPISSGVRAPTVTATLL